MFSLTGATRFKYIPNYKDLRDGYDKLLGVLHSRRGARRRYDLRLHIS